MFKRLTWLWLALLLITGVSVQAAERPSSMDRHAGPDEIPMNIVKILRTSNKAQTNSYVPVVFTMRNNNPYNVIRFLRRPIEAEEGVLFTFVSPEGNGGKVLYVVPKYMVESLAELVKAVDVPDLTTSSGSSRIYRQLKHRRADFTDPGFLSTAASFSTGNGSVFLVDTHTNAVYYEDAPSGTDALDYALNEWLDVPTAMVDFVVKIYELDSYNDGALGVDYISWKNGPGADLFSFGAFSEYGSLNGGNGVPPQQFFGNPNIRNTNFQASGYNYAWNYTVPSAFFDFLTVKGKAKILNEAKLSALNTWPAVLSSGQQILYYETSPEFVISPDGRDDLDFDDIGTPVVSHPTNVPDRFVTPELTSAMAGVTVEIEPVIGEESIETAIEIEWSDYNGFDGNGFPRINSRELSTDFRMKLGEEIIIGGLKRNTTVKSTNKVPILGSIPILGYAFGGEKAQNKSTELVVAVNPVAVMDYDVATDYAVSDDDQTVMDTADQKMDVEVPEITWGFDQYLIDPMADCVK